MEDSMKKPIMIVIIVVCLGGAGLLLFRGGSDGGTDDIPESAMKLVKCNNPACGAEYEMSKRQYFKDLQANMNPNPMAAAGTPAITCKECSKPSLFPAIECPNADCGTVFIEQSAGPNDYHDRCPKCGRSEVEDRPKRQQAAE